MENVEYWVNFHNKLLTSFFSFETESHTHRSRVWVACAKPLCVRYTQRQFVVLMQRACYKHSTRIHNFTISSKSWNDRANNDCEIEKKTIALGVFEVFELGVGFTYEWIRDVNLSSDAYWWKKMKENFRNYNIHRSLLFKFNLVCNTEFPSEFGIFF